MSGPGGPRSGKTAPVLLLALPRLQLRPEGIDVALVDDLGRHDDQVVGGDEGLAALEVLRHALHPLIAPFIGLPHDGAADRALLHAAQRDAVYVERTGRDLASLAGYLQRVV